MATMFFHTLGPEMDRTAAIQKQRKKHKEKNIIVFTPSLSCVCFFFLFLFVLKQCRTHYHYCWKPFTPSLTTLSFLVRCFCVCIGEVTVDYRRFDKEKKTQGGEKATMPMTIIELVF